MSWLPITVEEKTREESSRMVDDSDVLLQQDGFARYELSAVFQA
jgi:hypothetical protein